nr:hypothetical protein [Tanacetum cinerariifolium]
GHKGKEKVIEDEGICSKGNIADVTIYKRDMVNGKAKMVQDVGAVKRGKKKGVVIEDGGFTNDGGNETMVTKRAIGSRKMFYVYVCLCASKDYYDAKSMCTWMLYGMLVDVLLVLSKGNIADVTIYKRDMVNEKAKMVQDVGALKRGKKKGVVIEDGGFTIDGGNETMVTKRAIGSRKMVGKSVKCVG